MTTFFDTRPRDIAFPTDGAAHAAGDVVGGLVTIEVSPKGQQTSGTLVSICLTDDSAQDADLALYIYDSEPSTIADNDAFTLNAANIKKQIGKVTIATGDWETIGSDGWVEKKGSDVNVKFSTPDGQLYCYAVYRGAGTPTWAASALTARASFERD